MDYIFPFLHGSAMLGMAYIGYKHGTYIKKLVNTAAIKPYKEKVGFKPEHYINEDVFCNLTGLFSGVLLGRMIWPVALPLSALYLERIHGDAIRKFIKDLQ